MQVWAWEAAHPDDKEQGRADWQPLELVADLLLSEAPSRLTLPLLGALTCRASLRLESGSRRE